jgi:ribA/ribD-fused uncharacterized protein
MSTTTPRPELTDSLRTYHRKDVVIVYRTKERFGGLSNMASGFPLRVNGVSILTTEALYQACRFPLLPEVQREIIRQHSPMTAKMKSKPHRKNSRPDWDMVRYKVMRWCLRVKLAQHYEEFGALLLSTLDCSIVEQSRKDDYWGAIVSADEDKLIGQNVLGRLLMELREQFKSDVKGNLKSVSPVNIPSFLLLGKPIEAISSSRVSSEDGLSQSALF